MVISARVIVMAVAGCNLGNQLFAQGRQPRHGGVLVSPASMASCHPDELGSKLGALGEVDGGRARSRSR
jgi:hypothetical protein